MTRATRANRPISVAIATRPRATYVPRVPSALPAVRSLERSAEPIVAFGDDYPPGHLVGSHRHRRAQLIYASSGVMRVDTPQGVWVVPPLRGVWVPAGVAHEIRAVTAVTLRTLYVRPRAAGTVSGRCAVVQVSALLRELILRLVALGPGRPARRHRAHLAALVLDELRRRDSVPLQLPMPADPRILTICHALLRDPSSDVSLAGWARQVGASTRTIARLFARETGVSFGLWRRQVRLLEALTRLATGTPVLTVALDLGYGSPSAFAAMFRKAFGKPPSAYFER
jgi:AraC-like DNA-binding protein